MKQCKSVSNSCIHLVIVVIVLADCFYYSQCLNMWTSMDRSVPEPIRKGCVSPCKIFQIMCKNDGKCRQRGPDCTWYCECPKNCEGFFCEKIVKTDEETAPVPDTAYTVVKKKDKKHAITLFDSSILAKALEGISKKKNPDESKKEDVPRDVVVAKITDSVTSDGKLICPPGEVNKTSTSNSSQISSTTESIGGINENGTFSNATHSSAPSVVNETSTAMPIVRESPYTGGVTDTSSSTVSSPSSTQTSPTTSRNASNSSLVDGLESKRTVKEIKEKPKTLHELVADAIRVIPITTTIPQNDAVSTTVAMTDKGNTTQMESSSTTVLMNENATSKSNTATDSKVTSATRVDTASKKEQLTTTPATTPDITSLASQQNTTGAKQIYTETNVSNSVSVTTQSTPSQEEVIPKKTTTTKAESSTTISMNSDSKQSSTHEKPQDQSIKSSSSTTPSINPKTEMSQQKYVSSSKPTETKMFKESTVSVLTESSNNVGSTTVQPQPKTTKRLTSELPQSSTAPLSSTSSNPTVTHSSESSTKMPMTNLAPNTTTLQTSSSTTTTKVSSSTTTATTLPSTTVLPATTTISASTSQPTSDTTSDVPVTITTTMNSTEPTENLKITDSETNASSLSIHNQVNTDKHHETTTLTPTTESNEITTETPQTKKVATNKLIETKSHLSQTNNFHPVNNLLTAKREKQVSWTDKPKVTSDINVSPSLSLPSLKTTKASSLSHDVPITTTPPHKNTDQTTIEKNEGQTGSDSVKTLSTQTTTQPTTQTTPAVSDMADATTTTSETVNGNTSPETNKQNMSTSARAAASESYSQSTASETTQTKVATTTTTQTLVSETSAIPESTTSGHDNSTIKTNNNKTGVNSNNKSDSIITEKGGVASHNTDSTAVTAVPKETTTIDTSSTTIDTSSTTVDTSTTTINTSSTTLDTSSTTVDTSSTTIDTSSTTSSTTLDTSSTTVDTSSTTIDTSSATSSTTLDTSSTTVDTSSTTIDTSSTTSSTTLDTSSTTVDTTSTTLDTSSTTVETSSTAVDTSPTTQIEQITTDGTTTTTTMNENEMSTTPFSVLDNVPAVPGGIVSDISDPKQSDNGVGHDRKDILRNRLFSNSLTENVSDLKLDLLKMELHEKGLPNDLKNML